MSLEVLSIMHIIDVIWSTNSAVIALHVFLSFLWIILNFPAIERPWGLFLESADNFSGPESYFMYSMFTLRTQILLVLKTEQ